LTSGATAASPDPRTRRHAVLGGLLLLCLAATLAAGCGEYGGAPAGARGNLRSYLHSTPDECGLMDAVDAGGIGLDQARTFDAQVARITPLVERLRGLPRRGGLRTSVLSPDALERRLRREFTREYTPAEAELDRRALALLGAIPAGFDYREKIVGAAAADVVGVYDTEAERMLVSREGTGRLDPFELETLGHELVHALTDARLELPEGRESDGWGDSHLAASSLVEGDATLVEFRLIGVLEGEEALRDLLYSGPATEIMAAPRLPHFLAASFVFPYLEGIGFVCTLYERGGWSAVNAAYDRPPTTSAEILFPERYVARETPARPPRIGALPGPWKRRAAVGGVFGAADLLWLFEAPGNRKSAALSDPLERAAAWGGGRFEFWTHGPRDAVAIALVDRTDGDALCESMLAWYDAAFPAARRSGTTRDTSFVASGQSASFVCRPGSVVVAIGPDRATTRRLTLKAR
jgi:hypothetical protein